MKAQKIVRIILSAIAVVYLHLPADAQEIRYIDDSVALYVKNCEKQGEAELCMLCQDRSLQKRCNLYLWNTKLKQGAMVVLSLQQAKDLLANKPPASISGLKILKSGGTDYYAYKSGTATTYIFNTQAGTMIMTDEAPQATGTSVISRNESPEPSIGENYLACVKQAEIDYTNCVNGEGYKNDACKEKFNNAVFKCAQKSVLGRTLSHVAIIGSGANPVKVKK